MKGSPVNPFKHIQIGLCWNTLQLVFTPQAPGQGSLHFRLLQALFWGHSELTTHSDLQVGGLPIYPCTQEHTAWPLISLH